MDVHNYYTTVVKNPRQDTKVSVFMIPKIYENKEHN